MSIGPLVSCTNIIVQPADNLSWKSYNRSCFLGVQPLSEEMSRHESGTPLLLKDGFYVVAKIQETGIYRTPPLFQNSDSKENIDFKIDGETHFIRFKRGASKDNKIFVRPDRSGLVLGLEQAWYMSLGEYVREKRGFVVSLNFLQAISLGLIFNPSEKPFSFEILKK